MEGCKEDPDYSFIEEHYAKRGKGDDKTPPEDW